MRQTGTASHRCRWGPAKPALRPSSQQPEAADSSAQTKYLTQLVDKWDRICRLALTEHPELAEIITAVRPLRVKDTTVILGLLSPHVSLSDYGSLETAHDCLEALIQGQVHRKLHLGPLPIKADQRLRVATENMSPRQRLYFEAQQHPFVQQIMQQFEADVVAREPSDREAWLARNQSDSAQDQPG